MNVVAIILARGGSRGIPRKNIKDFCGKPLVAWTIGQALGAKSVNSVWVSSDDEEILTISAKYGAKTIRRPKHLSGNKATSESGWLHALEKIETMTGEVDLVLALQATSPLRESKDIEDGVKSAIEQNLDSLFSAGELGDFFIWKKNSKEKYKSINFDYKNRKRRQDFIGQYVENGSFYLFRPKVLRKYTNRLGGRIGITKMEFWKSFELDSLESWKMCEILMKGFLLR